MARNYLFYIPIVNGVTKRSRRFLHFQGSLIYNSSLNFGDFILIEEIPAVSPLLPAMTAGFVRCVNDDLPDLSVYDRRYQVRHIHIFILKRTLLRGTCAGSRSASMQVQIFPFSGPQS